MLDVRKVAQWFVLRAAEDVNKGGEYLTQLKLQKLLYYAQGFYMAFNGEKLYSNKIVHMQYGPVVQSMATTLKSFGSDTIKTLDIPVGELSDDVTSTLSLVYEKLGQYSAYKLVELTHNEDPWKNTNSGDEIKVELISKYFKENYIR